MKDPGGWAWENVTFTEVKGRIRPRRELEKHQGEDVGLETSQSKDIQKWEKSIYKCLSGRDWARGHLLYMELWAWGTTLEIHLDLCVTSQVISPRMLTCTGGDGTIWPWEPSCCNFLFLLYTAITGTSVVVQWLRLHPPSTGDLG